MAINIRWKRNLGRRDKRWAALSQGVVEEFGLYFEFNRGLKLITGPPGMWAVFNLFMLSAFCLREYGHLKKSLTLATGGSEVSVYLW